MGDNKKRIGHTDYRSLSKIVNNIRQTMQEQKIQEGIDSTCLLYTSPSPRDS